MENEKNTAAQRARLLYIYRILFRETDEEHPVTMPEIIEKLAGYGISAARKSVYDDITALKEFGADIVSGHGRSTGYFLASREFELPELALLADAVSSSKFITEKKSKILIEKLENLASRYDAADINRQIYVADRTKSGNEKIYLNIDVIHRAISAKKKISFRYFSHDPYMKKVYREGERVCSPFALTWCDEHYYLVAFYEKYPDKYTNFRVDRMEKVNILDEPRIRLSKELDLSKYLSSTFSMFSGKSETVTLRFDNSLADPVADRFGYDITPVSCEDGKFTISVNVKTEQPMPFFSWLFQFGSKAEIVSPASLKEKYIDAMNEIIKGYC